MKKIAASLLALIMVVCLLPAPVLADGVGLTGEGTSEKPYEIGSLADLKTFAAAVSGGNTFEDKFVVLTADIVDDGTFAGIGFIAGMVPSYVDFNGKFDGQGHTVTLNMAPIWEPMPSMLFPVAGFGFFTSIGSKGIVENIILDGTMKGSGSYGSICAYNYGLIRNCGSYVELLDNDANKATTYAAGLCSQNNGVIVNCFFYGKVSITATNSTSNAYICSTTTGGTAKVLNCCYKKTKNAKNISVAGDFLSGYFNLNDVEADDMNKGLADLEGTYGPLKQWYDDEDWYPVLQFADAPAHTHTVDTAAKHERVEATCTAAGNVEWYACTDPNCEAKLDASGNEIADVSIPIAANAHSWGQWIESSDGTFCERVCAYNNGHTEKTEHEGISCDKCGWKILPEITVAPDDAPAELLARAKVQKVLQSSPDMLKDNISTSEQYTSFRSWVLDNGIDQKEALTEPDAFLSYALGLYEINKDVSTIITEDTLTVTDIEEDGESFTVTVKIDGVTVGYGAPRLETVFGAVVSDTKDGTYTDCPCSDFTVNEDGSVSYKMTPASGTQDIYLKVTANGIEADKNGFRITYTGEGLTARSIAATALPTVLPVPERTDYVFTGWYLDNGFTENAVPGTALSGSVTLYAGWRSLADIRAEAKSAVSEALGEDPSEERKAIADNADSMIDGSSDADEIEQIKNEAVSALAETFIRSLVSCGDTAAEVSVKNASDSAETVDIIAAAYAESGRMVAVNVVSCTLAAAGAQTLTVSFTPQDEVSKISVFILRENIPLELSWTKSVN